MGLGQELPLRARIGLRLAPCALREEFPLQRKTNARARTRQLAAGDRESASRRLQSAEDGTAVGDWVLPHQCEKKRRFSQPASRELQLPKKKSPKNVFSCLPGLKSGAHQIAKLLGQRIARRHLPVISPRCQTTRWRVFPTTQDPRRKTLDLFVPGSPKYQLAQVPTGTVCRWAQNLPAGNREGSRRKTAP